MSEDCVGEKDPLESQVKHLKNCLEALEKLKGIRRELKSRLQKEGLEDRDEVRYARELLKISKDIKRLERAKLTAIETKPENAGQ